MPPLVLSPVPENDKERAFDTLVLAFATDPVERWLYPGSREYLTSFPAFLAAFGGRAFAEETVWSLPDFSAVALWLPPGSEADGDAIVAVLMDTVAPERHEDTIAVLGQMDDAHPRFPHWYLPWLGVDPSLQGRGLGGELLEQCLRFADEDHQPAYLETPNPRTIPFYERYGFEVTGEARAGACPPITFMLRAAR
jgi:ribosomal protein S18 acetylase RimI-like enzyme